MPRLCSQRRQIIIIKTNEVNSLAVGATRLTLTRTEKRIYLHWFRCVTACTLYGAPAMRPCRSSHTQVAGFPNACTQLNSWHSRSCLRLSSNSFHREAAHITPSPLKRRVRGHHCLVYIWSKQENMQRFDSQKIRQLFKSVGVFFSFSRWSRTRSCILSLNLCLCCFSTQSCLFSLRVLWWISNVSIVSRWSTWCFLLLLISILMTTPRNNASHAIIP